MKISKPTVSVLKNFSGINGSIMLKPGNEVCTVSPQRNIFAKFQATENFPVQVPLYDLNDMINALSLFDDPDCDFKSKHLIINNDKQKMKYVYSDEATVSEAPTINPELLKNPKAKFDLDNETLSQLIRASSVIGGDVLSLNKKAEKFEIVSHDKSNKDSNKYEIELEKDLEFDGDFSIHLLVENIKMLPLDYAVSMYENFIRFEAEQAKIEYIIAIEDKSTWE